MHHNNNYITIVMTGKCESGDLSFFYSQKDNSVRWEYAGLIISSIFHYSCSQRKYNRERL